MEDVAIVLVLGDDTLGFEVGLILPRDAVLTRHDVVGIGKRRVHIAARSRHEFGGDVVATRWGVVDGAIARPIRVDETCAGCHCRVHVDDRRDRLQFDHDERRGGVGDLERVGGDGGDRFAFVADDVGGEDRLVPDHQPGLP